MFRLIVLSCFCLLLTSGTTAGGKETDCAVEKLVVATQFEAIGSKHRDDMISLYKFSGGPNSERKPYKGAYRLVLKITNEGKAVLNPKGEGGWSTQNVDLSSLTSEGAAELWGKPRETADGIKTFDLFSADAVLEKDVYHFDTRFKDGKLSSYQIRGIRITAPEWRNITE